MVWKVDGGAYNAHGGDGAWKLALPQAPSFIIRREDYEEILMEIMRLFGGILTPHMDGLTAQYGGDDMKRPPVSERYLELKEFIASEGFDSLPRGMQNAIRDEYYDLVHKEEFVAHPEKRPCMDGPRELYLATLGIFAKYAVWKRGGRV